MRCKRGIRACSLTAATMQGGPGAWVGHIPASQQNAQGALISNFLRGNGIQPGMQYQVIVVPGHQSLRLDPRHARQVCREGSTFIRDHRRR
jgi:hypothetical protein